VGTKIPKADRKFKPEEDVVGTFQAYAEYNKILRTWFVALGSVVPLFSL